MTALLQACYRGNVEIARILVDSGANVNWAKHKQGYTALMFAALVRLSIYLLFAYSRGNWKLWIFSYHEVPKVIQQTV